MTGAGENEDPQSNISEEHELLPDEIHNGTLDEAYSPEIPSQQFFRPSQHNLADNDPPANPGPLKSPPSLARRYKSFNAMILLLLLGLLSAIAQHSLFSSVNGRPPQQVAIPQDWVIRTGTALAFLFKMSLVASVGIAFCQRSWYSFQHQAITIRGIDAIFGILRDPFQFFVGDMLKIKVLSLLAFISWLLPLSAIFSPASLTGTDLSFQLIH